MVDRNKPVVGVTFFLHKKGMPVWVNGAAQNVAFLWLLFKTAGYETLAVNAGDGDHAGPELLLDKAGLKIDFVPIKEAVDKVDVLIECGAQVYAADIDKVHKRGGRAVGYRFGNSFVLDAQRAITKHPSGSIFNGSKFDAIWTNAQHMHTCASYWQTCYRCRVECLPHIWEPVFVDAAVSEFPVDLKFGYQPGKFKKSIAIFEPNIDIVKTCYFPLLVCEEAYRAHPERVGEIYVTNAAELKEHESFRYFANNLDIVKQRGMTSFEGRYNTPWFMAKYGDVCVTHQWENGLNYLYYDILRGGYPLVHNSPLLPDGVGYRYHDFDAQDGGRVLSRVLADHDAHADEYKARADAFLQTVRATSPENIKAHVQALNRLFD